MAFERLNVAMVTSSQTPAPIVETTALVGVTEISPPMPEAPPEATAIAEGRHGDPFAYLGMHQVLDALVVRSFHPNAKSVTIRDADTPDRSWTGVSVHPGGVFETTLTGADQRFRYLLDVEYESGVCTSLRDPFSFGAILGSVDLHLFAEGNHLELYRKFGAHLCDVDGVSGCTFHVWAPNAQRVSVVGDWNYWDGRVHPMRKLLEAGVWEIFIPGASEGMLYKFEVIDAWGALHLKSDPFAFYGQNGIKTASEIFDLDRYQWKDQEWMERRKRTDLQHGPVSTYEVHLGSWKRVVEQEGRSLTYRELAEELLNYVVDMGFTHIELMPVMEHPFDGSWGYQVTGYFAATSRFGSPDDLRYFIDRAHQRGIGIILDWVPGHFPKDDHGLARFDGTALYEHADRRQGEHQDWGTLIFNYGRNEVRNFLIANALFWLDEYHIDGLRVDAVASMLYLDYSRKEGEWVPNVHGGRENLEAIYFLKRVNEVTHARFPGISMIAEESTSWPMVSRPTYLGGLGFDFKWNMGWMNDSLRYMEKDPLFRRYHHSDITFSMLYAYHEHFMLVISHDEVVHGKRSLLDKMPGDVWQKFANLRMFLSWMWAHPGKKLLFMGCEIGQWWEWDHSTSVQWHWLQDAAHRGVQTLVRDLNSLYRNEPAYWELDDSPDGFSWVDCNDSDNSVVSFLRKAKDGSTILIVVNATPTVRELYRVGVPNGGYWKEILNSDSERYGGSNVGNGGGLMAESLEWQWRPFSIPVRLPPLAVVAFRSMGG